MKKICLVAAVLFGVIYGISPGIAQSTYTPPAAPAQVAPAPEHRAVNAQELGNAILKILAAAPNDFAQVRGSMIDTGRSKGSYNGLVNMSSTARKSTVIGNGSYYILSVLNDVDKSTLSSSAALAMAVVKRAMGEGTIEKEEKSQFGTINYRYRNSNRTEWIELSIHPFGHLTLFIYKK